MMKKRDKKAFTLIELIVTIAVLGVLVLLASPRFFGYTKNAELTKGFANAKSIEKASEIYYMDHEDWPRLTDEPYTSEEIESYSERIFDRTGHEVNLDPEGKYYDIDYEKLSDYVQVPDDKKNYILQNPVGKVFYMDNLNETGVARVNYSNVEEENDNPISIGEPIDFAYTGQPQSIELGKGTYRLEVWGAQGGDGYSGLTKGGKGGYSTGILTIEEETSLHIFVGGKGVSSSSGSSGGFNGGGRGGDNRAGSGGGASDMRLNDISLSSRYIVAGGGGGAYSGNTNRGNGGAAGGLSGIKGTNPSANGGTQTSGFKLGIGGNTTTDAGGGGGGGYYGGYGSNNRYGSGGGGSGYIDGIQNGETIAGNQSMPNPNGGTIVGNSGHGFARITRVD